MMQKIDTNRNGLISFNEFLRFVAPKNSMKVDEMVRQLCKELCGDQKVFEQYIAALNRQGYRNLDDMNKVTTK